MNRSKIAKRIVIIGAVAAGTSAAAKARRNDEKAEIVIYEMDSHISYSGCGLPYYIGGLVEKLETLTPRDPAFFKKKYNVDVLIRHEVLAIDPATKTLAVKNLSDGTEFTDHYDQLILATGAQPVLPPIPGNDLEHVFVLRNPSHALAIRTFIEKRHPQTATVIGSGFIGMEMVENLMRAGLSVTLIEMLPVICPALDPDVAPSLHNYLESWGVKIRTGCKATAISPYLVTLDDGTQVGADLVILAVGIRPNTGLAKTIGIELSKKGAIVVNKKMQTNLPGIYACGDCAESFSAVDGHPIYRPLGSTANKMGRIAGDMVSGGSLSFRGILGTSIFKVFEMSVAATGLNEQEARALGYPVVISHNIKPDRPEYFNGREMLIKAIADQNSGRILGVQIVGFDGVDKRIDVFVTAMTAGLVADDLFHLDLAYAPPFSTTKDPVMYTGMILDNAISHGRRLITPDDLDKLGQQVTVIDARAAGQYAEGHIAQAVNLPQESLRDSLAGLDRNKPVVTYCNKGTTGNAAQNVLLNSGFKEVYNLSGGFKQYEKEKKTRNPDE